MDRDTIFRCHLQQIIKCNYCYREKKPGPPSVNKVITVFGKHRATVVSQLRATDITNIEQPHQHISQSEVLNCFIKPLYLIVNTILHIIKDKCVTAARTGFHFCSASFINISHVSIINRMFM